MSAEKDAIRHEFLVAFGKALRSFRTMRRMSQKELAERLEVSRALVSRYENGSVDMPLSNLPLISDAVGVPATDLLTETPRDNVYTIFERITEKSRSQDMFYITDAVRPEDLNESVIRHAWELIETLEVQDDDHERFASLIQNIADTIRADAIKQHYKNTSK